MAALTATDWTVEIQNRYSQGGTKKKNHFCKLTLATAGEYPTAGIPWPTFSNLGLVRNLDYVSPIETRAAPLDEVYSDVDNRSLRFFTPSTNVEVATTATYGAGGAVVLYVEAVGW